MCMYVRMYVGDGLGVCCVLCCYCVHAHNCIIVYNIIGYIIIILLGCLWNGEM